MDVIDLLRQLTTLLAEDTGTHYVCRKGLAVSRMQLPPEGVAHPRLGWEVAAQPPLHRGGSCVTLLTALVNALSPPSHHLTPLSRMAARTASPGGRAMFPRQ